MPEGDSFPIQLCFTFVLSTFVFNPRNLLAGSPTITIKIPDKESTCLNLKLEMAETKLFLARRGSKSRLSRGAKMGWRKFSLTE